MIGNCVCVRECWRCRFYFAKVRPTIATHCRCPPAAWTIKARGESKRATHVYVALFAYAAGRCSAMLLCLSHNNSKTSKLHTQSPKSNTKKHTHTVRKRKQNLTKHAWKEKKPASLPLSFTSFIFVFDSKGLEEEGRQPLNSGAWGFYCFAFPLHSHIGVHVVCINRGPPLLLVLPRLYQSFAKFSNATNQEQQPDEEESIRSCCKADVTQENLGPRYCFSTSRPTNLLEDQLWLPFSSVCSPQTYRSNSKTSLHSAKRGSGE